MNKEMKILNDKMSQQSRRALPAAHSFFCSSTCISRQVLLTGPTFLMIHEQLASPSTIYGIVGVSAAHDLL
jgi:hypothetical protein